MAVYREALSSFALSDKVKQTIKSYPLIQVSKLRRRQDSNITSPANGNAMDESQLDNVTSPNVCSSSLNSSQQSSIDVDTQNSVATGDGAAVTGVSSAANQIGNSASASDDVIGASSAANRIGESASASDDAIAVSATETGGGDTFSSDDDDFNADAALAAPSAGGRGSGGARKRKHKPRLTVIYVNLW